jgi:hypothetical protein
MILKAGDIFRRPRGFKRPNHGPYGWWLVGVRSTQEAPAKGWHMLLIDEIAPTRTFGRLVIHREWLVDPDGNEVNQRDQLVRIPMRKETLFKSADTVIRALRMRDFSEMANVMVPAQIFGACPVEKTASTADALVPFFATSRKCTRNAGGSGSPSESANDAANSQPNNRR